MIIVHGGVWINTATLVKVIWITDNLVIFK